MHRIYRSNSTDFQRSSFLEYVPASHRNTHGRIYLSRFKKPILFPSVIHSSTLLRNMWKLQTFAKSTGYVIRQTEWKKKDAITLASTVAHESIWTLLETFSRRITRIIFYKSLSAYDCHDQVGKVWHKCKSLRSNYEIFTASVLFVKNTRMFKQSMSSETIRNLSILSYICYEFFSSFYWKSRFDNRFDYRDYPFIWHE